MNRECKLMPVSVTSSASTTGEIDYTAMAGAQIRFPSGSLITAIAWYSSDRRRGVAGHVTLPCYKSDGTALTQSITAARAYQVPDELFGCRYLYAVATFSSGSVPETIMVQGKT